MSEEVSKNLSENLFINHTQAKETSNLIRYLPTSEALLTEKKQSTPAHWYRTLRRVQWAWQGLDPIDIDSVLAKIAASTHSRTDDQWIDTVMGYHGGNWAYEWIKLGIKYQKQARSSDGEQAADSLFHASLCFSVAGYPHLKNDNLALQAQTLANNAYLEATKKTQHIIKRIEIPFEKKVIVAHLHLKTTETPQPVVLVSAGLDSLQTDLWHLYRDHLADKGLAMLTIDMPGVGHNSHWNLTEDTSRLHQAVLNELYSIPWIDHHKVALIGFRFGGNAMVRLSFFEQDKIKACVAMGAPIHDLFTSPEKLKNMPKMYLDVLASRLGKNVVDIHSLAGQMMAWSLKVQGLLSSRKTRVPILAMSMDNDPVSPHSDNQMVALFSDYGKAKKIKAKTITEGYEQSLELAIKWIEDELKR